MAQTKKHMMKLYSKSLRTATSYQNAGEITKAKIYASALRYDLKMINKPKARIITTKTNARDTLPNKKNGI